MLSIEESGNQSISPPRDEYSGDFPATAGIAQYGAALLARYHGDAAHPANAAATNSIPIGVISKSGYVRRIRLGCRRRCCVERSNYWAMKGECRACVSSSGACVSFVLKRH